MFKIELIILTILLFFSLFTWSQEDGRQGDLFLNHLMNDDAKKAYALLEDKKNTSFNEETLLLTWQNMEQAFGKLKEFHFKCREQKDFISTVYYNLNFANREAILKIHLKKKKISGFFFVQDASCDSKYTIASYVTDDLYQEDDILLNDGAFKITLSTPIKSQLKVLCILLPGSGPQDKDASIGPNKPLKDLALGLASKGVSTIRFGKRSLKAKGEKYTINDEYTESVIKIIDYIRKDEQFFNYKIILLGHSLGGMISPIIAKNSDLISGTILMGANFRPLEDLLIEQTRYLLSKDKQTSEINKAMYLNTLETQVSYLKDSLKASSDLKKLPLNIPPNYWMSLKNYTLSDKNNRRKIKKPMLVLWGEKDYQVREKDFNLFKKYFQRKKNTFKSYPELNHIFMISNGSLSPEEYKTFNNIPEYVINDIINWLKKTYK